MYCYRSKVQHVWFSGIRVADWLNTLHPHQQRPIKLWKTCIFSLGQCILCVFWATAEPWQVQHGISVDKGLILKADLWPSRDTPAGKSGSRGEQQQASQEEGQQAKRMVCLQGKPHSRLYHLGRKVSGAEPSGPIAVVVKFLRWCM